MIPSRSEKGNCLRALISPGKTLFQKSQAPGEIYIFEIKEVSPAAE